jgi:hypothetical protein
MSQDHTPPLDPDELEALPESVRDELSHFLAQYPAGDWRSDSGQSLLRNSLRLFQTSSNEELNEWEQQLARTYSEVLLTFAQLMLYQVAPAIKIGIEGQMASEIERWTWQDGENLMIEVEEEEAEPAS